MAKPSQLINLQAAPTWLSTLLAGIILGLLLSIFAISLTGLIFVGPLADDLPRGIAMALVTVAVNALSMAFFSSHRGILAGLQDGPMVVMAAAVTAMVTGLSGSSSDVILSTVIMLIALTTAVNGIILILLGRFRLGILVRYLPYPVVGGFMAGAGILLVKGGISTMVNYSSTANLIDLFTAHYLELWLPGVSFGLIIFVATRGAHHSLTLPGLLLVEGIVLYLLILFSGRSVNPALDTGFLLGEIVKTANWPIITPSHIHNVAWGAFQEQGQLGNIWAVLILTPITLLLNLTGIEMTQGEDIDLDHELQAAGMANILSAFAGGMIGFHSLGTTSLGRQMTERTRTLSLLAGITPLMILFFGLPLLAFVPKALLGSLLVFQGVTFLYNWLVEKWDSLPLIDYGQVIVIALVIVTAGFLEGIMLGLVVVMITFLISYSRTDIFYRKVSGAEVSSHVQRDLRHRKKLVRFGWRTHILELHGFIFFGTANVILAEIQSRLRAVMPLHYLILDFRRVTGVDSSAAFSFTKAIHLAEASGFVILFSHLSIPLKRQLDRNGIRPGEHLKVFVDLDRALEWCEDALLECNQVTIPLQQNILPLQLINRGFSKELVRLVRPYLQKMTLAPNDILIREGESAESFYFIESGRVSIYMGTADTHRTIRLQTLCTGTLVGEVGFCLDSARSATIVADTETTAYSMTKSAMQSIQADEPRLALAFKDLMLRVIAERLVMTNREIAALMEDRQQ